MDFAVRFLFCDFPCFSSFAIFIAFSFIFALFGALRKAPPFHGSRSSREIKNQNASCQMGGREVTG